MDTLIRQLGQLNTVLTRGAGYIATALMMGMLVAVVVHVFYRYVLGTSFGWTEELSRTMMVWMAFLYFPTAHRYGMNVSLDLFIAPISRTRAFQIVGILIELSVFVLLCGAIYLTYNLAVNATSLSLALRLPMAYVYAIMPVGFAMVALISLERLLRLLANLAEPGRYKVHVFGSAAETGT